MNRRSFLQLLGLTPLAPAVIAAIPAEPELYGRAPLMDAIKGYSGLPEIRFRAVNASDFQQEWLFDFDDCYFFKSPRPDDEPDRIPPALRA